MATVNVLIVVDVEGALNSSLQKNVYLVDTRQHFGSGNEGQAELITVLGAGDTIIWAVAPIDPGTDVSISSFSGAAIGVQVNPIKYGPTSWGSVFEAAPYVSGTQYQYSVTLAFDGGSTQTFDPFLQCL